jgi:hypothetical protein
MTPQSSFMIVAPLDRSRIPAMRDLLATMNFRPGMVNPENDLIPFGRFEDLHFARLVVLDDQTTGDLTALYGVRRPEPPTYLAFLGDFDGSYDAFVRLLIRTAGPGLRKIFSLCEGFSPDADLHAWMSSHERCPATYYCNWVGRTVRQARMEERLRSELAGYLKRSPELADRSAREVHATLRRFAQGERRAGRLPLTPAAPTPFAWSARFILDWAALILLVVGGVLTLPLTLVPLLIVTWRLRLLEKSDPEFAPRPDPQWLAGLARLEDYGVTNQFTALGTLKPGRLREAVLALVLWIIDLTARVLYTKGRLARVQTIHFARWVYLDNRRRLFFASNYDGSLESYMDDFINKVGFGLNVVFSNGVGYPRTDWLLLKGAKNEQLFKYFIRRHELPTEVWYNAHAGLTNFDLRRNTRIRQGLDAPSLDDQQAREWVAML